MLREDVTGAHSVKAQHGDWIELTTGQDIWGADNAPVFHLADWYDSESLALAASAPTLKARLAELDAERDAAVGFLLDGMLLTFNPPEHRVRWRKRVEASGLLRVRPRAALDSGTPGGGTPCGDGMYCSCAPGAHEKMRAATPAAPRCGTCGGTKWIGTPALGLKPCPACHPTTPTPTEEPTR
jgi:hypothetical protein